MNRRRFLAVTSGAMTGFAGCQGGTTEQGTPPKTTTPFPEYDCPPHNTTAEAVVCSQSVDTGSASVYLRPSKSTVDASTETLELTLYNESSTELAFNPYQWSITRKTRSGWVSVEKRRTGDGVLTLPPGKTHSWTFGDVVDAINEQAAVGPGTYTASIDVPNPDSSDWLRCLALVRLV